MRDKVTVEFVLDNDNWEWSFTIKMINVREFKKHWDEIYRKV